MQPTEFQDYRDFLNYKFIELKKLNRKFSFQNFGMKYKTSRAYLKNVLSKKRHLSLNMIDSVADYLQLNMLEAEYVLYQFLKTQTLNPRVQSHFAETLSVLHGHFSVESFHTSGESQVLSAEDKAWLFSRLKVAVLATLMKIHKSPLGVEGVNARLPEMFHFEEKEYARAIAAINDRSLAEPGLNDQRYRVKPVELKNFKQGLSAVDRVIDNPLKHRPSHFEMGVSSLTQAQYDEVVRDLQSLVVKIESFNKSVDTSAQGVPRVFLTSFSICSVSSEAASETPSEKA